MVDARTGGSHAVLAGAAPLEEPLSGGTRRSRAPAGLVAAALLVGVLFTSPIAYLVYRNAVLGGDLPAVLTSEATLGPLRRTIGLAAAVTTAAAALGTALAWLVTRSDLPGGRAWRLLTPLPLVIPSFVGAAALVAGVAPGGLVDQLARPLGVDLPPVEGFPAAFLVLTLLSYPYVLLPVAARLASLPPSLEESARLLGRRPAEVFRTIVLPQAAGAVWAGALLVFLYVLSDFGAVSIVRYDTLTRSIYAGRLFDQSQSVALSLLLGLLAVAVVAAERLMGRRRVTTPGGRARRSLLVPLGRWRWPATALAACTVGASLVAPVAVLGLWAVRGLLNAEAAVTAMAAEPATLLQPALNTSWVGIVSAAVAVAVVLPVAQLSARYRTRLGDLPNAMVVGGFALPGLVIALALAFWSRQIPGVVGLYQSFPLLVLAYVVHFGAQGLRAADVAVAGVPRSVEEAAKVLGAGRWRRFTTVDLPLMRPGLLAGAGLVLLSTMKELPATLLLAPIGFDTLATRIWQANAEGFLAETGLTSLVLLALSGTLSWILVLRRADHVR